MTGPGMNKPRPLHWALEALSVRSRRGLARQLILGELIAERPLVPRFGAIRRSPEDPPHRAAEPGSSTQQGEAEDAGSR